MRAARQASTSGRCYFFEYYERSRSLDYVIRPEIHHHSIRSSTIMLAMAVRWPTGSDARCRSWSRSLVNCTPRVSIFTFISRVSTPVPQREGRCFRCSASLPSSEHGIIVERVKSGLSRAQSQGKRLGRRRVGENVVECIREQLATGAGILRTAKKPRSTAIFDQWSRSTACPTLAQAKRVLAQPVSKGTLISGSERLWRNIQVPSMLRCSLSAL